jgi:hypothetical protein
VDKTLHISVDKALYISLAGFACLQEMEDVVYRNMESVFFLYGKKKAPTLS